MSPDRLTNLACDNPNRVLIKQAQAEKRHPNHIHWTKEDDWRQFTDIKFLLRLISDVNVCTVGEGPLCWRTEGRCNKGDSYSHSSLTEEPDGETSARRAQGEDRQD